MQMVLPCAEVVSTPQWQAHLLTAPVYSGAHSLECHAHRELGLELTGRWLGRISESASCDLQLSSASFLDLIPKTHGSKKKQVVLWDCCQCGNTSMSIRVDSCSYCHEPRCPYCPVSKVKVKGRDGTSLQLDSASALGFDRCEEDGVKGRVASEIGCQTLFRR
ncbi:uncharacterized protein BCR38DRAFT_74795 [Pseudomassariella vexata]|uniref:Uncharacterized protein n=1 Tax=Pseudomassariella vexata TaxID=1141098 RepID=A0A1Y2DH38_9PEZI|nr:uncharacterized protein BCR38DRAFT_74795 [Pseudomassariella vexata]ORY58579.1 hypothetical protein BCR38DRAFT_74795 [Pseudomassariella vexata]